MVLHSFYGIIQSINAVTHVLTTGVLGHNILYRVIFMGLNPRKIGESSNIYIMI